MANFQSILDCFTPNFKFKHEDLKNLKTDSVSTVVFNLHQIKRRAFFMGHPVFLIFFAPKGLEQFMRAENCQAGQLVPLQASPKLSISPPFITNTWRAVIKISNLLTKVDL